LIILPEKYENKIVIVYCKKIGDRNRIYGFSFSPGVFSGFLIRTGAFCFLRL